MPKAVNKDGRSLSPEAREALRIRAVRAVREKGMSQTQVIKTMGVGRTSLHEWLCRYDCGGYDALKSKAVGRKAGHTALSQRQQGVIRRAITDKHPDQLKLPFVLWTREAVQRLIARRYGVTVALKTVGNYLRRWGLTPQKPVRQAYERCSEKVRQWLDEEYPAIAKRAKKQGGEIYWGDQMGLSSEHFAGRSYSPKGQTPTITTTGRRFSCSMMSAVTNTGKLSFSILKGRFNAGVLIEFLGRLIRHSKKKVFLILDGHPCHKAKKVKAWLADRVDRIELYFLPGYSPHLNPDEYLNQDVKQTVFKHERPTDVAHMKGLLSTAMRRRQKMPAHVASLFRHPDVLYAA